MKITVAILAIVVMVTLSRAKKVIHQQDLQCPAVERINSSNQPWNAYDKQVENFAKIRCGFKFERSPCLVYFEKLGPRNYNVLCGEKK